MRREGREGKEGREGREGKEGKEGREGRGRAKGTGALCLPSTVGRVEGQRVTGKQGGRRRMVKVEGLVKVEEFEEQKQGVRQEGQT